MARRPMDDNTRRRLAELRKLRRGLKQLGEEPIPYSGWSKNVGFSTPGGWGDEETPSEAPETPSLEFPEEGLTPEEDEKFRLEQLCAEKAAECTSLLNYSKSVGKSAPGQVGQAPDSSTRVAKIEYECFKATITCNDIKNLVNYEDAIESSTAEEILVRLSDEIGLTGDVLITFHKYGAVVVYHEIDYRDFNDFINGYSFGMGVNRILQPKSSSFEYLVTNEAGKAASK